MDCVSWIACSHGTGVIMSSVLPDDDQPGFLISPAGIK